MNTNSIIGMFGDGANGMTADMNRIIGRCPHIIGSVCSVKCAALHPFNAAKRAICLANCPSGTVPVETSPIEPTPPSGGGRPTPGGYEEIPIPPPYVVPPGGVPASALNILDLSSPINTIIKSIFLLSLSQMFAGSINFYFLSVGCTGAIIYSLFKLSNR